MQSLAGRYWTAIDVGVGPDDADILAEDCDYVFARASQYEKGFNPSEFTALGGFMGIQAVSETVLKRDTLAVCALLFRDWARRDMRFANICTLRVQS